MTFIIGLNGFKTSGKDTAYQLIRDSRPEILVTRHAFADKLKFAAAYALGYTDASEEEMLTAMNACKEDWHFEVTTTKLKFKNEVFERSFAGERFHIGDFTGRAFLQNFGAAGRVVFGEQFWVDQVLPKTEAASAQDLEQYIETWFAGANVVCITDCRYPNEAERILKLGGEVWEILRPGLESDGHASETPLPDHLITRKIKNDGTIAWLQAQVLEALYERGI